MQVTYFYDGISLQNKRKSNMDCLFMSKRVICGDEVFFFVVCDGVGGTQGGGEASTFCVRHLKDWFFALTSMEVILSLLPEVIRDLNGKLCEFLSVHTIQGATTLSILLLVGGDYYIFHLGDSRIYGLNAHEIMLLTEDQVDDKGRLTGYLGKCRMLPLYIDHGKISYKQFILCSDGFYHKVNWKLLPNYVKVKKVKKILDKMISHAVDSGETDNISVILVQEER